MNLNKLIRESLSQARRHSRPSRQNIIMNEIYEKIQNDVDQCLLYGPSNARYIHKQHSLSFFSLQQKKFFLNTSAASHSRMELTKRIRNRSYSFEADQSEIKKLALEGFWSATGTCETYAILGAMYLMKQYEVDVSIENIHSDLTHTFLRVHTEPDEYIFDFWSRAMIRYGDWVEWNETIDYEYRYTRNARFSLWAEKISPSVLSDISMTLNADEHGIRRMAHLRWVNASLPSDKTQPCSSFRPNH